MWQYALWALAGAASNRALLFLEACQRVKGWPWRFPYGPGAAPYWVATVLHLGVGTGVASAAAEAGYVTNSLVAFGIGAAAPVVVKKLADHTLEITPRKQEGEGGGTDAP
jgi:hypothetical protein